MTTRMVVRGAFAPVLVLLLLAAAGCAGKGDDAARTAAAPRWLCPMHPSYVSDRKGSCPICGMDLVPAAEYAAAQNGAGDGVPGRPAVELDGEGIRLAGVRTRPAVRGPLVTTIRAAGTVEVDETALASVQTRIGGWIESLMVNALGQEVAAGTPLLAIYSPELVTAQEDLVRALAVRDAATDPAGRADADLLAGAARRRLDSFGVPGAFVREVEQRRTAARTVTLVSPARGIVTAREATAGMRVEPGMTLLAVADLSRVWVVARFYEEEAGALVAGTPVVVGSPFDPGPARRGAVDFVYPVLDPAGRTLAARVVLPNPDGALRPGMYVDVTLEIPHGEALTVPDDAVLDTGPRRLVFVDLGGGRFAAREVTVGVRADGKAQILAGLAEGDEVAVAANFLLDSESRLRAALAGEGAAVPAGGHDAGGHR